MNAGRVHFSFSRNVVKAPEAGFLDQVVRLDFQYLCIPANEDTWNASIVGSSLNQIKVNQIKINQIKTRSNFR